MTIGFCNDLFKRSPQVNVRLWLISILFAALLPIAAFASGKAAPERNYSLTYKSQAASVAIGSAAACDLEITPRSGWKLKAETPFKAKLFASNGVILARDKYASTDFKDPKASTKTISTGFEPTHSGSGTIEAELSFFVCSDRTCQRQKDRVSCSFNAS